MNIDGFMYVAVAAILTCLVLLLLRKMGWAGVLLRKDYSVIITFQRDLISSKFVDNHLRCKGSRNYQQQDLIFCTNTQGAFVFLDK